MNASKLSIIEFDLEDRRKIKSFVHFPLELYKNCPLYIPKLNCDYLGNKLLNKKGVFEKTYPYHDNAQTRFFLAYKNNTVAARLCVSIDKDFNAKNKSQIAFFGFFDAIDDLNVSQALFKKALHYLQSFNIKEIRGPFNFTYNHTCGVLINAFDDFPVIEMPYNFDYYPKLLEDSGFKKGKDLFSYKVTRDNVKNIDRLLKVADRVISKNKLHIRPINKKNLKKDIENFAHIYNLTWNDLWSFVPISKNETGILANNLKPILIDDLFLFAEKNNQTVAVSGTLPNVNEAWHSQKYFKNNDFFRVARLLFKKPNIKSCRTMIFGVHPSYRNKGIETALITKMIYNALRKNDFQYGDVGWIHEDNLKIKKTIESVNGQHYKTHRIYSKNIL